MDTLTCLQKCPLFQGLEDTTREKLATLFQEKTFEAGAVLFREGDPSNELILVLEGTIDIVKGYRDRPDSGKLLTHIGPAGSIGEAALYDDRPRSASAIAREKSMVLSLGRQAFHQFSVEDPASAQKVFVAASVVLFVRLEHTSQELNAVHDLGKLLGQAPPLATLCREVVERLRSFVPQLDEVEFYLWNQFSEEFEPAGVWSRRGTSSASALTKNDPLIRKFLEDPQTIENAPSSGGGATNRIASPLVSDGNVIGFISLGRSSASFGSDHRNLLEAVCGMMVGAVSSAWAREEEKARQRLQQSKQRF